MGSPLPVTEPGGPGQSLQAAGILAVSAASLAPDPTWLRSYLSRAIGPSSTLQLRQGARDALIEQAVEIASSKNPVILALDVVDAYLTAADFAPKQAVPLISTFLQADVINFTTYDARAREALMRLLTSLSLPPRILYSAERELAALVRAVTANATAAGENVESVAEDEEHMRRRKNMKWLKVGAASVVGGLALGLSGGLMAPAILPALGTVGLTSVSGSLAAMGGGGAVALGSIFGAAGAGVGAAAMASRTGAIEEFEFERCTVLAQQNSVAYETMRLTPSKPIHEIFMPLSVNSDSNAAGGLLVWEILTSQDFVMIVPGRVAFGVQYQAFSKNEVKGDVEWLLPEEEMDVGGFDTSGLGKRRRKTGAITVQGSSLYILRFRLIPGSLDVNISYRVALVPPGKDPPLWVMGENEKQTIDQEIGEARSLAMAILVPGLLDTDSLDAYPGVCADQFISTAAMFMKFDMQCFALRWETKLLLELSTALKRLIRRMAFSMAAQNGAMMVVPVVVGAMALPVSIIGALQTLIGNTWARTISRASECGYMLAAELASRSFGNRPIVLAGYSAGAMVVFSCLQELARRNLVGIVHDAILVGAPCTADVKTWREVRTVVAGRLVNAYNPQDWYLELYHRGTNLGAVAGTRSIQDPTGLANVENICLSNEHVGNHMDYAKRCSQILVDLAIVDPERRRPWSRTPHSRPATDKSHFDEDIVCDPTKEGVVDDDDVILFERIGRQRIVERASSTPI